MIARHWRGWTTAENADAYEALLKSTVLSALKRLEGYRGGQILRAAAGSEMEFVIINYFESLDAVKRFAGENYRNAVFEPEARRLLSRAEPIANHYEVRE